MALMAHDDEPTAPAKPVRALPGVFVAGSMRSGTTWLGMLLSARLNYLCVGEASGLIDHALRGGTCSCGASLDSCKLWAPALDAGASRSGASAADMAEMVSARFTNKRLLVNATTRGVERSSAGTQASLTGFHTVIDQALAHSGCAGFVDTSKRMALLQSHLQRGREMRVVQIIRDPLDVAASHKQTRTVSKSSMSSPPGSSAFACSSRSTAAAGLTWLYTTATRVPRVTISYEDLRHDPAGTVDAVVAALGLPVPAPGYTSAVQHVAVGNPTRFKGLPTTNETGLVPSTDLERLTRVEGWTARAITAPIRAAMRMRPYL